MHGGGPKIQVACSARDLYFRYPFANCKSPILLVAEIDGNIEGFVNFRESHISPECELQSALRVICDLLTLFMAWEFGEPAQHRSWCHSNCWRPVLLLP
jgi:hypothetical protein